MLIRFEIPLFETHKFKKSTMKYAFVLSDVFKKIAADDLTFRSFLPKTGFNVTIRIRSFFHPLFDLSNNLDTWVVMDIITYMQTTLRFCLSCPAGRRWLGECRRGGFAS